MKFLATLVFWVALLIGMIWLIAEGTRVAMAHSFYPYYCCHEDDCFPLPAGAVTNTGSGYEFDWGGRHYRVSYSRANTTPHVEAGESGYHVCLNPGDDMGTTEGNILRNWKPDPSQNRSPLCFWAPDPGS